MRRLLEAHSAWPLTQLPLNGDSVTGETAPKETGRGYERNLITPPWYLLLALAWESRA